jgi:hypothetical protein
MLQRTLPAGFIAPCLPTKTDKLLSGSQWLHEIEHVVFSSKPSPAVGYFFALSDLRGGAAISSMAGFMPPWRRE